ncbi:hypothetical protein [Dictyobacter kobayashii]|uniref:DUF1737 domain-containing protein n=1 Tax=Dictyobacter kobayashii TaxID=2014872 RepID=A0A402AD47_9CHLR|nr:hypothetical protein [Dictyobacter kobayashii]GCE17006.1 hypothetical protein KDK_08060 [Dictyobacter kobayashii]
MQQFPQGYQAQMPVQNAPQPQQQAQEVKFYKSSIFLFASAAGKLERDYARMAGQGWKLLGTPSFVGVNFWLQRVICAVYVR